MKFITLGPPGSNHEYVMRNYLAFHGITGKSTIGLAVDFEAGAQAILRGEGDFLLQCAVHPATMATVAKYLEGLFVVDTFIAPSQDLAVIRRRGVAKPTTLAVMRPTLDYIDAARWENIEYVDTVAEVTAGLVSGRFDAGLGFVSAAEAHPESLEIEAFIGTVDDAWIVYGREQVSNGKLLAWRESPAAALYHARD
ncbi:hypothetical protein H4CHR_01823 [Variovorax sp. PBS-H4]|uniref:hypothetical protein n=1 Tax=Variovorax sp. PBS-H4 TaxID=434008 RepID=UPI001318B82E|nr:hypothetical protein [Variovorax sp. PBS-H4]VTU26579.1 hypothetical protein H4CHR_01823 [Variovorax sp. PBS-H4]